MEKALGKPLHDRKGGLKAWQENIQILARAPQISYDKLLADYKMLHRIGLGLDPSKPDNIFYNKYTGFSFIDLNASRKLYSLGTPVLFPYGFYSDIDDVTPEDFRYLRLAVSKLKKAGDPCPKGDELVKSYNELHSP